MERLPKFTFQVQFWLCSKALQISLRVAALVVAIPVSYPDQGYNLQSRASRICHLEGSGEVEIGISGVKLSRPVPILRLLQSGRAFCDNSQVYLPDSRGAVLF